MQKPLNYKNRYFRILSAFGAALFIVLYGTGVSFFKAFYYPSFYLAFGISFLFAMILVNTVHYITVQFDRRYPWGRNFLIRAVLQLTFGWLLPVFTEFLMASVYFHFIRRDIFKSGFMLVDFNQVAGMLMLLNAYYIIHFFVAKSNVPILSLQLPIVSVQPAQPSKEIVHEDIGTDSINVIKDAPIAEDNIETEHEELPFTLSDAPMNISYFFRYDGHYWMRCFDGKENLMSETLVKVEATYKGQHFFRINRYAIINRQIIESYDEQKHERGPWQLKVKPEMVDQKHIYPQNLFVVSRKKVKEFKEWMEQRG